MATWLLCLTPRRIRDAAFGDLYEEYSEFALAEMGRTRARLWYWSQVVGLLIRYRTPYGFVARCIGDALGPERRLALGRLARETRQVASALRVASALPRVAVLVLASGAGIVAAFVGGGSRGVPGPGPVPSDMAPLVAVADRTDTTPEIPSGPVPAAPVSVFPMVAAVHPAAPILEPTPVVARATPQRTAEATSSSPTVPFDSAAPPAAVNMVVGMDPLTSDSGKPPRPRNGPYQDDWVQP